MADQDNTGPEHKMDVKHTPTGTLVTCIYKDGAYTARWTVKTYASHIKEGARDALAGARKGVEAMKAAADE